MAAEKVVGRKITKNKGSISLDSVATRLKERSLFVTASKAPDEAQSNVQADSSSKRLGPIRKAFTLSLMGLTLASASPQFAFAGGQDEKNKIITKNELVSPDPTNAPVTTTELNVAPMIGGTTFSVGKFTNGKLDDPKPDVLDVSKELKRLGVDKFPEGSIGLYFPGVRGKTDYFACFYVIMPNTPGVITARYVGDAQTGMLNGKYGALTPLNAPDELAKVGILPTSKLGKDYTVDVGYNEEEKVVYLDFKIGSKNVISFAVDLSTGKVTGADLPAPKSTDPLGQK